MTENLRVHIQAQGARDAEAAETKASILKRRVASKITRKLDSTDTWISAGRLRADTLTGDERGYFDPIMANLVDGGLVEEQPTANGQGVEYRTARRQS